MFLYKATNQLLLLCLIIGTVKSEFQVPKLKLEALKSRGFRVFIPDTPGTSSFKFHANINENITQVHSGNIIGESRYAESDYWIIQFSQKLNIGDSINYWIFVSINQLGYRVGPEKVTISELLDEYPPLEPQCVYSPTTVAEGKLSCAGQLILHEQFERTSIDNSLWTIEQYIPTYSEPNFEFNSYENKPDNCFITNGNLHLKPTFIDNEARVRGTLDLRDGCTSKTPQECFYKHASSFLLPPVKSGKITSKLAFRYGKVEIKARLPCGDWIYPIIELTPKHNEDGPNTPKIWVAYSRGNINLKNSWGEDIGASLLSAGPVLYPNEQERTKKLVTRRSNEPYCNDFHVYRMDWIPGEMIFYMDGQEYGNVSTRQNFANSNLGIGRNWVGEEAPFNKEFILSFGIGVGGVNDFPDGYISGDYSKPWVNGERNYIKNFFDSRYVWLKTWKGNNHALVIDYVKIWAV